MQNHPKNMKQEDWHNDFLADKVFEKNKDKTAPPIIPKFIELA